MNIGELVPEKRKAKGMWWSRAWSLVEGCTPVSEACDNCWSAEQAAMRQHQTNPVIRQRYAGLTTDGKFNGEIRLRCDNVHLPMRTEKLNLWALWNDLFNHDVPDWFIARAFEIMEIQDCRRDMFVVLTKRPARACDLLAKRRDRHDWSPPQTLIMGTTAENQKWADIRIPQLLDCPAATHAVSIEPMLGPVTTRWADLDWVILGAETGRHARPMNLDWARDVRDQCKEAGVPFFFKSAGPRISIPDDLLIREFPEVEG